MVEGMDATAICELDMHSCDLLLTKLNLAAACLCCMCFVVVIANERRSESVQAAFLSLFSDSFTFKKVPLAKQDPDYSHPAIELYILKKKKGASDASLRELEAKEAADMAEVAASLQQLATSPAKAEQEQQQHISSIKGSRTAAGSNSSCIACDTAITEGGTQQLRQQQQQQEDAQQLLDTVPCSSSAQAAQQEQQQQFQTRRAGVQAARLLATVQVPRQEEVQQ